MNIRSSSKFKRFFRGTVWAVLTAFLSTTLSSNAYAQNLSAFQPLPAAPLSLPDHSTIFNLTEQYHPIMMKGIEVFPDNPLRFDFIIDAGDSKAQSGAVLKEGVKLIKYFLASLTVPEDDL
ncbi:MAG: hypothetical protein KC713_05930, partial [Candidatus Omnitrophica bacterium]|nr:hypothetical protein [Candidatus Omnitrophota bacterium]